MTLSGLVAGVVLDGECGVIDVVTQRFVQGMGVAFGVWTVLIGVSVIAVLVAMGRGWREALLRAWVRKAATRLRRTRARDRARLLAAYADRVAEARRLAAASVRERRDEWEAAERTLQAAWQARCAVDVAAARLAFATIPSGSVLSGQEPARPGDGREPDPVEPDSVEPDPVESAGRGRLVRRLATEAYRRGDLSGSQLVEVLTGRGAWSARHDLVELETRLCMTARDHRSRQYRLAVEAERKAWDALEAARGAHDALCAMRLDPTGDPAYSAPLPVPAHAWRPRWAVTSPVHSGRTS
jgi:hypothetical protein